MKNFGIFFEKCLKGCLLDFLTAQNILHGCQYGFQKGKLTADVDRLLTIPVHHKNVSY